MKPAARRRARECAVQALYSWQLSQNAIADVEYQFLAEQDVKDVDVLYFRELLAGVATNTAYLDGLMKPYLSSPPCRTPERHRSLSTRSLPARKGQLMEWNPYKRWQCQ